MYDVDAHVKYFLKRSLERKRMRERERFVVKNIRNIRLTIFLDKMRDSERTRYELASKVNLNWKQIL